MYVKWAKREREEHPKGKSPSKIAKVWTSGEDKEANKGKPSYIATITRGAPREKLSSKGTMKKNIVEMLAFYKKDGST